MTAHAAQTQAPDPIRQIAVGIDTHQATHHVAVIDLDAREVDDRQFPATSTGNQQLEEWITRLGDPVIIGIESTSSYGASITRHLIAAGHSIVEVNQPDTTTRRNHGKSDPLDALNAARAALTGRASITPKITTGIIESIRCLMIARDSAVKAAGQALMQIRDLATTAPDPIRDQLLPLTGAQRVKTTAGYRPDTDRLNEPTQAVKHTLRSLAHRHQDLTREIRHLDKALDALVAQAVPTLLAEHCIGTITAARLAISAGQNPQRFTTEARFAKLTGTAPLPVSSGKSHRHRLNRGGDRQANSALYMIAIGRMKNHPATRAYITRRTEEGLSKPDAIRCLKRHLVRPIYKALKHDLARLDTP